MLILISLLLLLFGFIEWCGMFNQEDLCHCVSRSFDESLTYMHMAYTQTNSRLGEMSFYLLAMSPHGDGAYHAQILSSVLTPIFLVAATLLIFRIALPEIGITSNKSLILLIFVSLCLLGSKQGLYWFDGNLSWLYPCVIAMLFFVLWEGMFQGNFRVNTWKFLLSVPMAVVVGMSNENTAIVSLFLFLGCGVYASIRQKSICITWQYMVIAALLLAAAVVFYTAPCRSARAEMAGWELTFHNILFNSLLSPTNWLYTTIFYWRETIIVALMVYFARKRGVKLLDRRMACLLMVLIMLWGVLIAAPCWGAPRSYTPLDLMLFAIMARMFCKIVNHERAKACDIWGIMAARTLLTLTILVPTVVLALAQYRVRCQIAKHADAALARGETRLVLRKGDLDISPVMPRFFYIPGCIVAHDLQPFVPLIEISKARYESVPDFSHRTVFPYQGKGFSSCGDDVLNRGVAKRFGLESILYVVD